ncbi:MAG: hypothetical protein LBU32_22870 [Clostridiales bacterium]|nr:hypothetical protein [Clostridiales bacterium]
MTEKANLGIMTALLKSIHEQKLIAEDTCNHSPDNLDYCKDIYRFTLNVPFLELNCPLYGAK